MRQAKVSQQSRLTGAVAGAILIGSGLLSAAVPVRAATTTVHNATAYGAEVNVGSVVKLGKIAPSTLASCSTQAVASMTATAASAKKSPLLATGLIDTSASSTATSSTGSSDVFGINLLGGVISATEIKAVSSTTVDGSGKYHFSTDGSVFSGLKVAGIPISVNPAPNTSIDLAGIGHVVLNEQTSTVDSVESKLSVNMIHVYVTLPNVLGYGLGTEIIVADASSQLKKIKGPAALGGYAEAPDLLVAGIKSGPIVEEIIPCSGTNGAVETDSVASANLPGVLGTGVVKVTGSGNINNTDADSEATTSVAGLNLLSGLVAATAIQGSASAVTTDGINFDFTGGSTFVGISVAGHPEITDTISANTKILIANLGTLYLNRVQKNAHEIRVTPIELDVNATNTLGLPIGAVVKIGVSDAQLHNASIP